MKTYNPPLDVENEQIRNILRIGHDNLTEAQLAELIVLIPCYVMSLREEVMKAIYDAKLSKQAYQQQFALAFQRADGSVEAKKMKAAVDNDVVLAELKMIEDETSYEYVRNIPGDWLELQQALKRVLDGRRTNNG